MMRVYPLHIGDTKVPWGQFYGGLTGWSGLQGLWRFATDKSRFVVVPIYAYLITHPRVGVILVDTGICWAQAHRHDQYYAGLLHAVLDDDEYRLAPEQELPAQLTRLGFHQEDVSTVVLTHLHEDHVGGLRDLPPARVTVVASGAEWRGRHVRAFGVVPIFYQPSFADVRHWRFVEYTSGPFANFPASEDLLGDGSIVLLPTPGHSPGHQCVLVRMGDYDLLLAGDSLYTLRHLAVDSVRALQFPGALGQQQVESIRRLQALRRDRPQVVVVPGHDHTDYASAYLVPFLADGILTVGERAAIAAYEASVFAADGHLRPAAVPVFVPAVDRRDARGGRVTRVGTVTSPPHR